MRALAPGQLFIVGLLLKMAMTAAIAVAASMVVERSGPFGGALDQVFVACASLALSA